MVGNRIDIEDRAPACTGWRDALVSRLRIGGKYQDVEFVQATQDEIKLHAWPAVFHAGDPAAGDAETVGQDLLGQARSLAPDLDKCRNIVGPS